MIYIWIYPILKMSNLLYPPSNHSWSVLWKWSYMGSAPALCAFWLSSLTFIFLLFLSNFIVFSNPSRWIDFLAYIQILKIPKKLSIIRKMELLLKIAVRCPYHHVYTFLGIGVSKTLLYLKIGSLEFKKLQLKFRIFKYNR